MVYPYIILSTSLDPDLEIILEVNLNFQVRLTIIFAFGIFSRGNGSGGSLSAPDNVRTTVNYGSVYSRYGSIVKTTSIEYGYFFAGTVHFSSNP